MLQLQLQLQLLQRQLQLQLSLLLQLQLQLHQLLQPHYNCNCVTTQLQLQLQLQPQLQLQLHFNYNFNTTNTLLLQQLPQHYTTTTTTATTTTTLHLHYNYNLQLQLQLSHATVQLLQYTTPIKTPHYNFNYTSTTLQKYNYNYNLQLQHCNFATTSTPLQLQLQLPTALHHTTSRSCGEVTSATIATTPGNTTPTTFRSISGFALPSVQSQQPTLPIGFLSLETSATALRGTTGIHICIHRTSRCFIFSGFFFCTSLSLIAICRFGFWRCITNISMSFWVTSHQQTPPTWHLHHMCWRLVHGCAGASRHVSRAAPLFMDDYEIYIYI